MIGIDIRELSLYVLCTNEMVLYCEQDWNTPRLTIIYNMFVCRVNSSLLGEVDSFYASFSFRQNRSIWFWLIKCDIKKSMILVLLQLKWSKMDPIIESKTMRINIKVMVLVYDFDWSKRNKSWYMLDHKKWHDISISYVLHDFPSMKRNLWLMILTQTGIGCEFNYHLQTKFHFLNKIFGQQNWSHKRQTLSILQVIPMVVSHRYPSLPSNT